MNEREAQRHDRVFSFLGEIARDVPRVHRSKHAAAIVYKNEIVAIGTNQKKSHPLQKRFAKNENNIFIHAELDAIKNALREITVDELSKSSLYVCRMKYVDTHKRKMIRSNSCPCEICVRAISAFSLSEVLFTTDNQGYSRFICQEAP